MTEPLDEVLRRVRGRVVAALVRTAGSLDAAEEAFQDAALSAVTAWAAQGVPESPAAWLTTVAKNRVRDAHRHRAVVAAAAPLLKEPTMTGDTENHDVADDLLRLVFTCCHPALPPESRVALTLKVVLGLTTEEIARAFLAPEPTIAQRIVRAKRTIEEKRVPYEVPERAALRERLSAVLAVVYLLFNEGHTAREGALMRLDLQAEALRLARLLAELVPDDAEVLGLVALVALSAARAKTRVDDEGAPVLLEDQDRSRWDASLVDEAVMALRRARRVGGGGAYQLQAEIAACHVVAPSWERTDWSRILAAYDALVAVAPSPVVALNRAVAVAYARGAEDGLAALAPLEPALARYHLFHATRAELLRRVGRDAEARAAGEAALALATNDAERALLRRRLARPPVGRA